jgi:hypothetical protein
MAGMSRCWQRNSSIVYFLEREQLPESRGNLLQRTAEQQVLPTLTLSAVALGLWLLPGVIN